MDTEPVPEVQSVPKGTEMAQSYTPQNQTPKRKKQKLGNSIQSKRVIRITREKYQELIRKRQKKSPWCRPSRNRQRYAPIYEIIDDDDDETEDEEKSKSSEEEEEEINDTDDSNPVEEKMEDEKTATTRALRSPGSSKPNSPLGPGCRISFQSNNPRCTRPHSPASARSSSPGRAAAARERKNSGIDLELISEHSYSKSPDRSPRLDNSPLSVTVTEPLTIDTGNRNMPILMNEDSNKENDPLITPVSSRASDAGDCRVPASRKVSSIHCTCIHLDYMLYLSAHFYQLGNDCYE
jgi:hypothetical protein